MNSYKKIVLIAFCMGAGSSYASSTSTTLATRTTGLSNISYPMLGVMAAAAVPVVISFVETIKQKLGISGKSDASDFYRQHIHKALRAYGVSNPEQIISKNNSSNNSSMSDYVETFMRGIVINERLLDSQSMAERIYTCYHEAAHYALKHGLFSIRSYYELVGTTALAGYVFGSTSSNRIKILAGIGGALGVIRFLKKIYCKVNQPCLQDLYEKEADAMAIEYLIKTDQRWVVEDLSKEYAWNVELWNNFFRRSHEEQLKEMKKRNLVSLDACQRKQQVVQEHLDRWNALCAQVNAKIAREQAVPRVAL